jgi:hypothetical protein
MVRRNVSGPFRARSLGTGVWHLAEDAPSGAPSGVPSGAEIYLHGAGPEASEALHGARIAMLGVEWHPGGVKVALTVAGGVRYLTIAGAIIHQPKARLYESLPLASFDTDAKRFWTRVFRLMRIPGGRFLLKFIARRNRGKSSAVKTSNTPL